MDSKLWYFVDDYLEIGLLQVKLVFTLSTVITGQLR